ncbi:MAG: ImmA/IrrE family metallo-endopeptidase [Planctomycetota bacterium]|jgi:Zn-dependent peptidase ImmA (M78 family)
MIQLNVPYLKDSDIASVADSFLKQNHVISIPVNIEYVIESSYRMDIVPTPGLLDLADTDGYSSADCTAIYVDEFVYNKRYFRYRFTLAHELGHIILHKIYFDKLKFSTVSEWKNVVDQLDPSDYSKMEYQAYMFAGMALVPAELLRVEFKEQLRFLDTQIEQARSKGLSREDYVPTVLNEIAYGLSSRFEVSIEVLSRRIKFECLEQEIR